MSDTSHGEGWWLASDGKWYPPESHPNYSAEGVSRGTRRRLSTRAWLTIAVCVLYVVSPLDVLPEALLGPFGLPDDVIVILIGVKAALSGRRAAGTRR